MAASTLWQLAGWGPCFYWPVPAMANFPVACSGIEPSLAEHTACEKTEPTSIAGTSLESFLGGSVPGRILPGACVLLHINVAPQPIPVCTTTCFR